jgi:hypothetical protein
MVAVTPRSLQPQHPLRMALLDPKVAVDEEKNRDLLSLSLSLLTQKCKKKKFQLGFNYSFLRLLVII